MLYLLKSQDLPCNKYNAQPLNSTDLHSALLCYLVFPFSKYVFDSDNKWECADLLLGSCLLCQSLILAMVSFYCLGT
jgi:hypothetical protein